MHQRHKHLLVALREFPHRFLHHGVAAGEASFLEPLPYPLGRVPLLARQQLVLLEDLFDALLIRPQLGLRPGLAQPLAWRLTVRQDLFERELVHPRLPENLPLAHLTCQHPFPHVCPVFHNAIHASLFMKMPHF